MKKSVFVLLAIAVFIFISLETSYAQEEVDTAVNEQLDNLDFDDVESSWNDTLKDITGQDNFKQYVTNILSGQDAIELGSLLSKLGESLLGNVKELLPMVISIVVICVLNALVSGIKGDFLGASISSLLSTICYCAILVVSLHPLSMVTSDTLDTISSINDVIGAIFPINITLLSAVGCTSASGGLAITMSMLSKVIVSLIKLVILPLFSASMVLAIIGNLSSDIKLSKLRAGIGSVSNWILGLMFGIFSITMTAQSVIAGSIDNILVRSTKMALSGYVPILGQYLSDGVDIVFTTTIMIKNAVGVGGLVILLTAIILPVLKIVIISLVFRLTSGLVETFADNRLTKALDEFGKNVNLLSTAMLGCAFVSIVGLMSTISIGGIL